MEKMLAMGDVLELDESLTGFTCYTRKMKTKDGGKINDDKRYY
jgi:hypothetical protein